MLENRREMALVIDKRILSEEAKVLVAQIAGCQNLVEAFVNMILGKVRKLEKRILELEQTLDKKVDDSPSVQPV